MSHSIVLFEKREDRTGYYSRQMTEREYRHFIWKIRRQRAIRNRILFIAATICLITLMAVSYHAIVSNAETEIGNFEYKYYKNIQVEYGDSLWSIAQDYADDHYDDIHDYIYEVKQINHMKDEMIREGQKLLIPYYSAQYVE